MKKTKNLLFGTVLVGFACLPVTAAAVDFAVAGHAGTMGTGLGAAIGLTDRINLRLGLNSAEYEVLEVEDDEGLDYENPKIDFDNQYLLLDFYPFAQGSFHLTAGYFANSNSISTSARVTSADTRVGNQDNVVGAEVRARIDFDDGFYTGIGWGNAFGRDNRFHFGVDLGVISLDSAPTADIDVTDPTGRISNNDIEREENDLEDELKDADMWPLINLSFGIRF